jgi:hypothetical protein
MITVKKRGRPKGSKNKPRAVITPVVAVEEEITVGTDGILLNPITVELRDPIEPFVYIATSCGCRITKSIIGAGMFCKHKNSMRLQK